MDGTRPDRYHPSCVPTTATMIGESGHEDGRAISVVTMVSGRRRRAEPARSYNMGCPPVTGTTAPDM
jgi:hypothetical protein